MNAATRVCALLIAVCLLTLTIFAAAPEEPEQGEAATVGDSGGEVALDFYIPDAHNPNIRNSLTSTMRYCVADVGQNNNGYQNSMRGVREKIIKTVEELGADVVAFDSCSGIREK